MYFDARVEPQFILLVNGGEMTRQVGYNFGKLETTFEKVKQLHNNDLPYYGNSKDSWERFYDDFDRWAKYGQNDRDVLKGTIEGDSDNHRGAGTGKSFF